MGAIATQSYEGILHAKIRAELADLVSDGIFLGMDTAHNGFLLKTSAGWSYAIEIKKLEPVDGHTT